MKSTSITLLLLVIVSAGYAQVDEIKKKSSEHSSSPPESGGSSGGGRSGGAGGFFLVNLFFDGFAGWQTAKLQQRDQKPAMVSMELYIQTAVQPSSYYIVNPRLRANWGLFSTDFRFNWLVEEDVDGIKYLRTDDWQILQLNVVTARNVGLRIGGGFMHESFSGGKTFGEWTIGATGQSDDLHIGGVMEYRGAEVRKEWSAQLQYRVFDTRAFHGFVTVGFVHQRYYDTITTWGIQGGLVIKLY